MKWRRKGIKPREGGFSWTREDGNDWMDVGMGLEGRWDGLGWAGLEEFVFLSLGSGCCVDRLRHFVFVDVRMCITKKKKKKCVRERDREWN